jgi:hypothetical protein
MLGWGEMIPGFMETIGGAEGEEPQTPKGPPLTGGWKGPCRLVTEMVVPIIVYPSKRCQASGECSPI